MSERMNFCGGSQQGELKTRCPGQKGVRMNRNVGPPGKALEMVTVPEVGHVRRQGEQGATQRRKQAYSHRGGEASRADGV